MTQGYSLSATVFNMLVEVVLCNWVTVLGEVDSEGETGPEGFGWDIKCLVAIINANDGLLASTLP